MLQNCLHSQKSPNLLHLFCPISQKPEVGFKIIEKYCLNKTKITFSKVTQLLFTLPNLIILLSQFGIFVLVTPDNNNDRLQTFGHIEPPERTNNLSNQIVQPLFWSEKLIDYIWSGHVRRVPRLSVWWYIEPGAVQILGIGD